MMINNRILIILILSIFVGSLGSLSAQIQDKLYFQNFTVDDGLSGNLIRDITQDSLGFMWFATEGGITRYDGYDFEVFRNIPGDNTSISDDDVFRIITDKYGNVWVDTFIGIDKYDPLSNRFTRHFQDPTDSTYLEPGVRGAIIPTKISGDIWIGTIDQGLLRFNPLTGEFKKYQFIIDKGDTLQIDLIEDIAEDNDGNIWVSALPAGLLKHDLASDSLSRYDFKEEEPSFFNTQTYFKEEDPSIFNPQRGKQLFVDDKNTLWVDYASTERWDYGDIQPGDETGLWQLDIDTGVQKTLTYHPVNQPFTGPLFYPEEDNGIIWFARPSPVSGKIGLHAYSKTDNDYRHIQLNANDRNSLINNQVNVIYFDTFGSLWAGTSFGLSKADISRKQLESFSPDPIQLSSEENNFSGIIEILPDVFWISRLNRDLDLIEWNRNTGSWHPFNIPYNAAAANERYFRFSNGIGKRYGDLIWFTDPQRFQMNSYNLKTGDEKNYPLSENRSDSTAIFDFRVIDSSTVWINNERGLKKLDVETNTYTQFSLTSPFIVADTIGVTHMALTKDDKIWSMTIDVPLDAARQAFGTLLHKFDPETGIFSHVNIDQNYLDALNHGFATAIMTDSKGDVWISKSNGLVHFDVSEEHFTWYNEDDGLADLFVLEAIEDNSGMIWLTTQYGLSMFDPERNIFRNFERSDGLRPVRMRPKSIMKRDNGEIVIIGYGGLNVIDPDAIEEYGTAPNAIITELSVDGNRYVADQALNDVGKINLPWDHSVFEIAYSAINFRSADKTTYAYKMDGLNDEFIDAGNRRFAQFTNLEPGDYTFRVRATNAEGISSENDTLLAISILPPWWRSGWAYGIYVILFAGGVFAVDRVQRRRVLYKEKERAREKELAQAKEIEKAYQNLEVAHENLKSAQDQLVQQEKLASLGQLTAGIAHEIKNPLNFVNNFSELSIELVEEAREELRRVTGDSGPGSEKSKGKSENTKTPLPGGGGGGFPETTDKDEMSYNESDQKLSNPPLNPLPGGEAGSSSHMDYLLDILDDIETNLKTIHKHGSRADGIVKSMLEHSRGGSGKMEPTDLNALAKEFVNLSFHGMRAGKDSINVDIDLQLDENVGEIPLVAEDFSRVILNLCNNAFDALREKGIQNSKLKIKNYSPKLTVRTKAENGKVVVEVEDNGPGIPNEIKDKILQPFFTTKKGTAGTGLGLSITNDIVKAHGGKFEINSSKNGTNMIVTINN